jgi:hypothetical protein
MRKKEEEGTNSDIHHRSRETSFRKIGQITLDIVFGNISRSLAGK